MMDIGIATAPQTGEFRGHIYDSILDTIGATPLVRLRRIAAKAGVKVEILGKCEFFNPLSSVGARPSMAGKTIVVVLPDFAERYLSTALCAAYRSY